MARTIEQKLAADLDLCDLGLALVGRGRLRRKYEAQRKACFAALKEMNRADRLDQLSDEEILSELEA